MATNYTSYTCTCGDTWSSIAYAAYNNALLYVPIMECNHEYSDVMSFNGGEIIKIPVRIENPELVIQTPFSNAVTITIVSSPFD